MLLSLPTDDHMEVLSEVANAGTTHQIVTVVRFVLPQTPLVTGVILKLFPELSEIYQTNSTWSAHTYRMYSLPLCRRQRLTALYSQRSALHPYRPTRGKLPTKCLRLSMDT